jgi:NAD(P)-dependent dehydrogenase (short-subunit alcohol dehydrogenase family)
VGRNGNQVVPVTSSRIALVTGGTSGIGAAVAEGLASHGWTVVIVARDRARGESTCERIRQTTANSKVHYLLGDLSSQRTVRQVAHDFCARYRALHLLINNVGAVFINRRESVDGIEMTLALNHLAPFLLTHLLRPVLHASAPARIINVSSSGHHLSQGVRKDDLQWRRGIYRGFQAYHQSKLANLLFTYELARRLEGTNVTVNAVHPGFVSTNIGRDNPWYWRLLKPAIAAVFRVRTVTADESARGIVHLAMAPDIDRVTGQYFADGIPAASSSASRDVEMARWLWSVSEQLTGLQGTGDENSQTSAHDVLARIVDRPNEASNAVL